MKQAILIAVVLVVVGSWLVLRARSRTRGRPAEPKKNPADAGRAVRQVMLTTPPAKFGVKPSQEFPRIYGILMDWPIGELTATVFSTSTGAASLYTTSTF